MEYVSLLRIIGRKTSARNLDVLDVDQSEKSCLIWRHMLWYSMFYHITDNTQATPVSGVAPNVVQAAQECKNQRQTLPHIQVPPSIVRGLSEQPDETSDLAHDNRARKKEKRYPRWWVRVLNPDRNPPGDRGKRTNDHFEHSTKVLLCCTSQTTTDNSSINSVVSQERYSYDSCV